MPEHIPDHLADLILDATQEGFKIEVKRKELVGDHVHRVYTTLIKMSHPKGPWRFVERGFPDYLSESWHRESFADLKASVLNGIYLSRPSRET